MKSLFLFIAAGLAFQSLGCSLLTEGARIHKRQNCHQLRDIAAQRDCLEQSSGN